MSIVNDVADMSLRCNLCKSYMSLSSVEDHKKYHKALRIMRYKTGCEPEKVEALCKRKKVIVLQLLAKYHDQNIIGTKVDKVNYAFEFLRSKITWNNSRLHALLPQDGMSTMRDGYFHHRDKEKPDTVVSSSNTLNMEEVPSLIGAFGTSQIRDPGIDPDDFISLQTKVHPDNSTKSIFLGLFDGYHGNNAAKQCKEMFHKIFRNKLQNFEPEGDQSNIFVSNEASLSSSDVLKTIKHSYIKMDQHLSHGIGETSRVRWSGVSGCTLFISETACNDENTNVISCDVEQHLFAANAGDVRAVLYHHGKSYDLSKEHSTSNQAEVDRIVKAGGHINTSDQQPLVCGVLKQTRGLGNNGNVALKHAVISSPYTCSTQLNHQSQILVVASEPIWRAFNNDDVLSILLRAVPVDVRSSMILHGPTPITPILHKAPHSETPEIVHHRRIISSELPSIVETEEENEISEVVIVEGHESDSSNSDIDDEASSFDIIDLENARKKAEDEIQQRRNHAAQIMAEQLVRATMHAKVTGHASVAIILFKGFFK